MNQTPNFGPRYVQTTADPTEELIRQQIEAQRTAAIADSLQYQADQPLQGNGAPISPLQGLAKLLQSGVAGKLRKKGTDAQLAAALANQRQFDSMFPGSTPPIGADPVAQANGTPPGAQGSLAPSVPMPSMGNAPVNAAPAPGMSDQAAQLASGLAPSKPMSAPAPAAVLPNATQRPVEPSAAAAAPDASTPASVPASPVVAATHAAVGAVQSLTGDPAEDRRYALQLGVPKYFELLADRFKWTDQQKNDAATGITAAMRRTMEMGSSLKGAVVPGSTATLDLDASGNVRARDVDGLRANSVALTGQTEAAKAENTPRMVPTGSGSERFMYPGDVLPTAPAFRQPGGAPGPQAGPAAAPPRMPAPATNAAGAPNAVDGAAPASGGDKFAGAPKLRLPNTPGASSDAFTQERIKGAGVAYNELNTKFGEEADAADQRIRLGNQIAEHLANATTGPASGLINAARGFGVQFGILSPEQADKLTNSTELNKVLIQNGLQDGKQMFGSRYTQSEVGIMLNQANASGVMSAPVIQALTTQGLIKSMYQKQRAEDFGEYTATGHDPQRFQSWYASNHSLQDFTDRNYAKVDAQVQQAMAASNTAAAPNKPSAPVGIQPGTIVNGQRFKGGDYKKRDSWEPVR